MRPRVCDSRLKSAETEADFQLNAASYLQSRDGDVSFKFQAAPIEQDEVQPQSLSIEARFDEGVHWDISGTDFPLERLEPLLVRFEREERVAGQFDGHWTISQDQEQSWQVEGARQPRPDVDQRQRPRYSRMPNASNYN